MRTKLERMAGLLAALALLGGCDSKSEIAADEESTPPQEEGSMATIERLGGEFEDTEVTDAGLVHLKGMTELVGLSLMDTSITDAGLDHLAGLTELRILTIQRSKVTDAGVDKLKAALPKLSVAH